MSTSDERETNSDSSNLGSSTTSFVYPVRTLLSGIQRSSISSSPADQSLTLKYEEPVEKRPDEGGVEAAERKNITDSKASDDSTSHNSVGVSSTSTVSVCRKHSAANLRDISDKHPSKPRTFISNPTVSAIIRGATRVEEDHPLTEYAAGPTGEPIPYHPDESNSVSEEYDTHRFANLHVSEAAADAFAESAQPEDISTLMPVDESPSERSNFSQLGLVHLGPSDTSHFRNRSLGLDNANHFPREWSSSPLGQLPAAERGIDVAQLPSNGAASIVSSARGSLDSSSDGPAITFRYQHVEDNEGHHLIVGREGKILKCEDEPIRTPGAVQGFGVLIAIEEDCDTGDLIVRQVSENSTELLGLSPSYLFSLQCFSQILSDSQADLLFENIQYLSDSALTPEEQAENLHVFTLHGYGEPGSALGVDSSDDPQRRRYWSCWCAAHRPQMTAPANLEPDSPTAEGAEQNLIVLEFELECDHFNPLYPTPVVEDVLSGISSPSDASGSTSGSNSTDVSHSGSSARTLVSNGTGSSSDEQVYRTTPEGSNPSVNDTEASTGGSSHSYASMTAASSSPVSQDSRSSSAHEVNGSGEWIPNPEDILESTTSRSKPLLALERMRRSRRLLADSPASTDSGGAGSLPRRSGGRRRRGGGAVGMMDIFAVMAQINEQFNVAQDMDTFLKIVVGVIKDLTQFHRVLVYQFDEVWNGKVVAELVDWNKTHDLYQGLHFPAADIPAQARNLYALNKVRILYDRGQPTARLVVKSKRDLKSPLDMTHCYLRAMSPIHLKYLGNMGVRASMSVSIIAFGKLWGLVALHSYGPHGMRVSFPVRQILRLLSQSVSRNIERLCYVQRLQTRKLINTMPTDAHPAGYIVADANDLLGLFDADFGVLVIGEGAKILGPNQHGQEVLVVAEYLRMKQFSTMQISQAVTSDYPDLHLQTGLEVIAGLLYIPLSIGGGDFIAFLRKGQPTQVNWAGRPYSEAEGKTKLEPRNSFKLWSEVVAGRCRAWTDEQLETAGVLALVYGKFVEVWRQKESALQTTKLTNILLSNASHEVRTPLNHIINYLEMALNGQLDIETRENLSQSHAASKSLLYTINDLLDLTRLESGNETSFFEPFDLHKAVHDATLTYRNEAHRRSLGFNLDFTGCPRSVVGDSRKIRTVVANLTANALKYTSEGSITVLCRSFEEPPGLRSSDNIAVEIVVSDTGCGIYSDKLESIFREFEQIENPQTPAGGPLPPQTPPVAQSNGLGLGLAVVARIVEQLGGQLRVDSKPNEGSRFSFLIPFATSSQSGSSVSSLRSRANSERGDEINSLVHALKSHPLPGVPANFMIDGSSTPSTERDSTAPPSRPKTLSPASSNNTKKSNCSRVRSNNHQDPGSPTPLRILIVEDNDINRTILAKRLMLDGHTVVNTTNGQEGLDTVAEDPEFDCVLMDIQMPLLNGYEATEQIRVLEQDKEFVLRRHTHLLNGRIPIFAVSASLFESQFDAMYARGMDGWISKPLDFKRLRVILRGVTDTAQRARDVYRKGFTTTDQGGWFVPAKLADTADA